MKAIQHLVCGPSVAGFEFCYQIKENRPCSLGGNMKFSSAHVINATFGFSSKAKDLFHESMTLRNKNISPIYCAFYCCMIGEWVLCRPPLHPMHTWLANNNLTTYYDHRLNGWWRENIKIIIETIHFMHKKGRAHRKLTDRFSYNVEDDQVQLVLLEGLEYENVDEEMKNNDFVDLANHLNIWLGGNNVEWTYFSHFLKVIGPIVDSQVATEDEIKARENIDVSLEVYLKHPFLRTPLDRVKIFSNIIRIEISFPDKSTGDVFWKPRWLNLQRQNDLEYDWRLKAKTNDQFKAVYAFVDNHTKIGAKYRNNTKDLTRFLGNVTEHYFQKTVDEVSKLDKVYLVTLFLTLHFIFCFRISGRRLIRQRLVYIRDLFVPYMKILWRI